MKIFRHTFKVTGRGQFPIDMLRYDGCYPKTGEDAAKIEASFRDPGTEITVSLERFGEKTWAPERARWSSFLWRMDSHEKYA
jgi:hypothetical protein